MNQLIILSSLYKSKQEMSSGSICSLLKLSLTVFSMYQHGVSTNSRGALERELLDLMASAFQQQERKNVHHIAYPSNFASGRLAHFE